MLNRLKKILRFGRNTARVLQINKAFHDGHFYSPIVDTNAVRADKGRIWPSSPQIQGVDFNIQKQRHILRVTLPEYLPDYSYHEAQSTSGCQFYHDNSQFSGLDALMLFVMLRELRPKRMIEIGSGFSSLLTADVNSRFLNNTLDFTCIEPYPRDFLRTGVSGINNLIESKVQSTPLELFEGLSENDILFIDSSHVSKTGSDVNHIYFEILPRLKNGVFIHIHDIFFPYDYPEKWVLGEGRSWNEQYIVQALLMYSKKLEVIFGCAYALATERKLLSRVLGGSICGGGSLWLRKTA